MIYPQAKKQKLNTTFPIFYQNRLLFVSRMWRKSNHSTNLFRLNFVLISDPLVKRQLESIRILGTANLSPEEQEEVRFYLNNHNMAITCLLSGQQKQFQCYLH